MGAARYVREEEARSPTRPVLPERLGPACVSFVLRCTVLHPDERSTALQLLEDPWITDSQQQHRCISPAMRERRPRCFRKMRPYFTEIFAKIQWSTLPYGSRL
jgi:hypothetical protein